MRRSDVQKKINKYKKMSTKKLIYFLVILLVAAVVYVLTESESDPYQYSIDQNPNTGEYYYQYDEMGTYYFQANDLEGEQLQSQLNIIINNGFIGTNYGDARDVLAESDLSIDDPTKLWNIYNGDAVLPVWDSGVSWAREHVWPNSRLGLERVKNSETSQASDLHNLRSITPQINSSRSNRFYSDGSGEATTTDDGGFYPGDEHKGDVARILFYMSTMYDFLTLTDDLEVLDDDNYNYELEGANMGKLSLLLEWHKEDPVSDFEIQRNEVIYEAQGNRNPFIDHPEYVHLIWEDATIDQLLEPEEPVEETADNNISYRPWKESSLLWMVIH